MDSGTVFKLTECRSTVCTWAETVLLTVPREAQRRLAHGRYHLGCGREHLRHD